MVIPAADERPALPDDVDDGRLLALACAALVASAASTAAAAARQHRPRPARFGVQR